MSKVIAVVGATGTQGASVVDTFLELPGWKVRGLTRDPTSKASQELASRGVEVVKAELDDQSSLVAAFKGATAVFAVTDFWGPFFDPASTQKLKPGQTINEYSYDLELQRGKNMANAAATTLDTLERYVWSSLSDATKWSKGKYTWVYHFDSKAHVADYINEKLPELAKKTSLIQVGMYASNHLLFPILVPTKQPDGTFVVSAPVSGKTPLPYVVTRTDTGPFVKALVVDVPAGKNLLAYSEMMSAERFLELWGKVNGVKARYEELSGEGWQAMDYSFRREARESFEYLRDFGYEGQDPTVIHPSQLGVKVPVTKIADWIKEQDWTPVLSAEPAKA